MSSKLANRHLPKGWRALSTPELWALREKLDAESTRCPACAEHPGWATDDALRRSEPADLCPACLGSGSSGAEEALEAVGDELWARDEESALVVPDDTPSLGAPWWGHR